MFSSHICGLAAIFVFSSHICVCRLMQHVDEVPHYTYSWSCLLAIFVFYLLMMFSSHICVCRLMQHVDEVPPYTYSWLCLAAIFVFSSHICVCRLMQHVDEVPHYTYSWWCLSAIFVFCRLMQHVDEVPGHKRNVQRARYRDGSRQIRQDGALHRPLPRRHRNHLRHRCEYRLTHSRLAHTQQKRSRKANYIWLMFEFGFELDNWIAILRT